MSDPQPFRKQGGIGKELKSRNSALLFQRMPFRKVKKTANQVNSISIQQQHFENSSSYKHVCKSLQSTEFHLMDLVAVYWMNNKLIIGDKYRYRYVYV